VRAGASCEKRRKEKKRRRSWERWSDTGSLFFIDRKDSEMVADGSGRTGNLLTI